MSPNRPRTKAVLYSEEISMTEGVLCMNFVYFMNSSGAAAVRIHQVNSISDYNPLWEHKGQGFTEDLLDNGVWRHAKVPLSSRFADDFIVRQPLI